MENKSATSLFVFMLGDLHLTSKTPISRVDDYPESVFGKLEYVFSQAYEKISENYSNEAIILLPGDLFHLPAQPDMVKNRFLSLVSKYGLKGKIYAVFGNHDSIYYNEEYNHKTSLGLLTTAGIPTLLSEKPLKIFLDHKEVLDIIGLPLNTIMTNKLSEIVFPESKAKKFLVAHAFLEGSDKLSLGLSEVKKSSYFDFILLGHDHNQYLPLEIECESKTTVLFRPGALSRATSSTEDKNRKPSYCLLTMTPESHSYEMCVIPHLPDEDVYRYKSAEESVKLEKRSFEDIQEFIERLSNVNKSTNPYTLLNEMGLSKEEHSKCVEYLHSGGVGEE